ncbi:type VI secretion system membrane subunit TssM [Paraburkholderia edwinii]|uniref:Type VI secretion system membrane subunit TssM n=1 Tax=Paraburkholderia edwinii TaxID=2861782 RepID=A0ABX8UK86_9BURK|nr:type VI secretion system membrane subunit TssM [Paraburkholderia edwinii]QYD69435.1 type VI secretion system membrane subunit TssM [Paraburkholderia edwinii]
MKLLSFLGSRWSLALVALAGLSAAIWFLGPYVAFGTLKPFTDVGVRMLIIALVLTIALLRLRGMSTSPVFVALLCLLIWYAAPLIAFGQHQPFASTSSRIVAIGLVLACLALYWLIWALRRMQTDKDFLDKALRFGTRTEPSPAADRLRTVEARMNGALARLKGMRTGATGFTKLFQGARYLYELPWYVVLGSNGSGKTSALLHAGLQFPVGNADQLASAPMSTGDIDWWLANNVVLIDTPGRYTSHGNSGAHAHAPAQASAVGADQNISRAPVNGIPAADDANHRQQLVDADEWRGFIALLRRRRPRAPVNGALLVVKLDVLTSPDPSMLAAEATALRSRLEELRSGLGVRFPVYLLITQADRLPGFADYFGALTKEHRAQMWGFTLPVDAESVDMHCQTELTQLAERISNGLNSRLDDEYDMARRQHLAALPEAFGALSVPLVELVSRLFGDSRYDVTQSNANLRGVYFTSAVQSGESITPEPLTVVQRLETALGQRIERKRTRVNSAHGYFLQDLFDKVILPEAHLVRPNLHWEYRSRALQLAGHALALLLFAWLAVSLYTSFHNNSDYLDTIHRKTSALAARVSRLYEAPKQEAVPEALTNARTLPAYAHLDLSAPDSRFRYGLYSAPGVIDASRLTYQALEDNLLLPQIVRRMEDAISQSIFNRDAKSTYDALRVYLMLYDRANFSAGDIKAWVLDDWAKTDSAAAFGGRAAMIGHVEHLFSGERYVQSPLMRNDALIQRARAFLDSIEATERLYERAKADMEKDAPDEFSLLRVIGPHTGTVFTRASGAPLARGVPGLFTFDGYRKLFDKRLHEFLEAARDGDAWVMGRLQPGGAQKKTVEIAGGPADMDDPLVEAVRRLYLIEYARNWDMFLTDLRVVSGTSLAFDLQVLRRFAAPDSPLVRLVTAVVHETTLTRSITNDEPSLLQKTAERLADKADKTPGIRAQERAEREIVDSHFAALREMVTGSPEVGPTADAASKAKGGVTGIDGMSTLLNDYYTSLMVADSAIANNSLPPASDAASKLRMAANTMPAPLREVLLGLSSQGSLEVNQGVGRLLSRQMQAVIGDTCRLTIEGNYPFAPGSARDVSIEDFTRLFAQDGVLDNFFTKNLAPFVDTSARPWRYKTLPGSTEPVSGPDLEPFQHAKAIREVFFSDQGQKQVVWKTDIRVAELDPSITGLAIDIDGQGALYQHGPVMPLHVTWPGPRGGVHAELTASPRIRADTSTVAADGGWAFMRLLRRGEIVQTATPGRTRVVYDFDGRKAVLDIANAGSLANPLTSNLLTTFRCPRSAPVISLPDSGPPPGLPPAP